MKGKSIFSSADIEELKCLIEEKQSADSKRKKSIRRRMRAIGFYSRDDWDLTNITILDFEALISSGKIPVNYVDSNPQRFNIKNEKTKHEQSQFVRFDPKSNLAKDIIDEPGNYIICLKKECLLPEIGEQVQMKLFKGLHVIYTGVAEASLRTRGYNNHFVKEDASRSTLRLSLGSMFGYPKIYRDRTRNKKKFKPVDEKRISFWMSLNLILFYSRNSKPLSFEDSLINEYNPPLNLGKNKNPINKTYRNKISSLRSLI